MAIIDLRGRPPTPPYKAWFIPTHVARFNRKWMGTDPAPSYQQGSLDLFFKEMDEAGITQTVCTGRAIPLPPSSPAKGVIPNSHLHDLVTQHPDRCIAVGGIDPAGDFHDPVAEIEKCVKEYGCKGVQIEPGRSSWACYYDDRRLYPLYEKCVELGVPMFLMSGPMAGPDLTHTHPARAQRVATDFPTLQIVMAHGCWPLVEEVVGVAFRHDNIHVSPDMYAWGPGHEHYVQAANSFMRDRFLFGTAYPAARLKESVERFLALGLRDDVLELALFKNAQQLLKLG